ncbi:hypothetical protein Y032_0433g1381 [Ancylostoma ceylanicum]|nr:hypothetical protein Y032_0433g1381 [Ancylostoma ceylanicum]
MLLEAHETLTSRRIGETLAVRCYSAWEAASTAYSPSPDLKTIKKLSNEELINFMHGSKRRKSAVVPSDNQSEKPTSQSCGLHPRKVLAGKARNDEEVATLSNHGNGSNTTSTSSSQELDSENMCYVSCQPSDQAEVVLIADVRENHGSMRGNTVVDYLTSSNHRVETRALSVGDYLWVLRKIDGTEVVLDWVVERKTWHDLQQSIRLVSIYVAGGKDHLSLSSSVYSFSRRCFSSVELHSLCF